MRRHHLPVVDIRPPELYEESESIRPLTEVKSVKTDVKLLRIFRSEVLQKQIL